MIGSLLGGPAVILISEFIDEDRKTTIDLPPQTVDDELLALAATLKIFYWETYFEANFIEVLLLS